MSFAHIYRHQPDGESLLYAWFAAMHTRVDIMLRSSQSEEKLLQVVGRMQDTIATVERCGNCFDPTSELARVNEAASRGEVSVSDQLYDILTACRQWHELTKGLFDVTTDSTDFASDTFAQVILRHHAVSFLRAGLRINLSGFLKGYAIDRLKPIVIGAGIHDSLLNMGNSSVMALGSQAGRDGWEVGLAGSDRRVVLHDECMTTSGNDTPERRHIVNPLTGELVTGQREVAVVTRNGAEGEVLSTAFFIADEGQRERLERTTAVKRIISIVPTV